MDPECRVLEIISFALGTLEVFTGTLLSLQPNFGHIYSVSTAIMNRKENT
jgi:hypothetical protein